jgi:hypothetical protein
MTCAKAKAIWEKEVLGGGGEEGVGMVILRKISLLELS